MKKSLLLACIVFAAIDLTAQMESAAKTESTARQKDSLENCRPSVIPGVIVGGNVSIISVDLEKLFYIKPFFILGGGIGMGFTGSFTPFHEEPDRAYFTLPVHLTGNFGKGRSFAEIGLGGTLLSGGGETIYLYYPMLGYRLLPLKSRKFSLRAWIYYPFGQEVPEVLTGGFGASFGIAF